MHAGIVLAAGLRVGAAYSEVDRPAELITYSLPGGSSAGTGVSTRTAQRMFTEAARLTVTLGNRFGIPTGSVNLPLDIVGGAAIGLACATAYHLVISRPSVRGADVEEPAATPEPALGGSRDTA